MLFNSYVFIFAFLPVVLLGFWAIEKLERPQWKPYWLIAASLFFYSYWKFGKLPVILVSMAVNYAVSILTCWFAERSRPAAAKWTVTIGVSLNVVLLGYYKYTNFFIENFATLFGCHYSFLDVALPLGISFFTFQQIIYLVDVYKGRVKHIDLKNYILCVCFFPHLIAGPIIRYQKLLPQFSDRFAFRFRAPCLAAGVVFFVVGLAKKVLVADTLAPFANTAFAGASNMSVAMGDAWLGAFAYSLQLYFDFSGYSDMAVGLGLLFGIELPVNFNSPYKSTGCIDFWRRWHITLSSFLRDYLYIPLGGGRCGKLRQTLNLLLTMGIGGLWHGAGWTFIAWGSLHGAGLVVNHLLRKRAASVLGGRAGRALSQILTFFFVVLCWVLFRADNMAAAWAMYAAMFGGTGPIAANGWPVALIAVGAALVLVFYFPNTQEIAARYQGRVEFYALPTFSVLRFKPDILWASWFSVMLYASLTLMTGYEVFLYFNF